MGGFIFCFNNFIEAKKIPPMIKVLKFVVVKTGVAIFSCLRGHLRWAKYAGRLIYESVVGLGSSFTIETCFRAYVWFDKAESKYWLITTGSVGSAGPVWTSPACRATHTAEPAYLVKPWSGRALITHWCTNVWEEAFVNTQRRSETSTSILSHGISNARLGYFFGGRLLNTSNSSSLPIY